MFAALLISLKASLYFIPFGSHVMLSDMLSTFLFFFLCGFISPSGIPLPSVKQHDISFEDQPLLCFCRWRLNPEWVVFSNER